SSGALYLDGRDVEAEPAENVAGVLFRKVPGAAANRGPRLDHVGFAPPPVALEMLDDSVEWCARILFESGVDTGALVGEKGVEGCVAPALSRERAAFEERADVALSEEEVAAFECCLDALEGNLAVGAAVVRPGAG